MDPELERRFLSELEELDKFRLSYLGAYPNVPLAREDPDVRRLLEALAFFTARTRLSSERTVGESLGRLLRQQFPYLVTPVPGIALLAADPSRRYVDVSTLPQGTEIELVRRGATGADEVFHMRTLAPLRILPIAIDGVDMLRAPGRGHRILVRLSAQFARNDDLGELDLWVDYLNDLHSSLLVGHELRTHLRRASVVWSHRVNADTAGEPIEVAFGGLPHAPDASAPFDHPLEAVRAVLHAPQTELYVRLSGMRAPRNWRELTICFDVDDEWPSSLILNTDCFALHVVPIVNARRATADPIEHDGTRDRHAIRHPDRGAGLVPFGVRAVYRSTDTGLEPLAPTALAREPESWEAVVEGTGEARRAFVVVNLPDAFERPETLVVDALWHQPGIADAVAADLRVRLSSRFVEGVEWRLAGPIVPPAEPDLESDRQTLLDLLSIRSRRVLGREEIVVLLRSMGVHRERAFAKLLARLARVDVVEKPNARRSGSMKRVYEIGFDDLAPSDLPRLDVLTAQLFATLSAWSADEVVEIVARVPNLSKEIRRS